MTYDLQRSQYNGVNPEGKAAFRFEDRSVGNYHLIDRIFIDFDKAELLRLHAQILDALTDPKLGVFETGDEE